MLAYRPNVITVYDANIGYRLNSLSNICFTEKIATFAL